MGDGVFWLVSVVTRILRLHTATKMDASGVEALIKTSGESPETPNVSECETTRVSG